jgi:LacI family transcriptional regulator
MAKLDFTLLVEQMPARVTLRDIAAACGYHYTTVGLALRGHPSIPSATRRRIEQEAQRMGYAPDPALAALAAYRLGQRPPAFHSTIAFINTFPDPKALYRNAVYKAYHRGAAVRCVELGYKLEELAVRPGLAESRRAVRLLEARGIRGLVVAPLPPEGKSPVLPWDRWSAVRLGTSAAEPALSLASNYQFGTMTQLVAELRLRGYRRIGHYFVEEHDRRVGRQWSGAFLAQAATWPAAERVPSQPVKLADRGVIAPWIRKHRPDAIICSLFTAIDEVRATGRRIPEDIGIASEVFYPSQPWLSAMNQNNEAVGAAAIDLLASMIVRGERGPPAVLRRVLIDSVWHEGQTLRPRPTLDQAD